MTTSWLLPLEPSMMVTVLAPGGGVAASPLSLATVLVVGSGSPSWREYCRSPPGPALACAAGCGVVATTAVGSPPSGSLTKTPQVTIASPNGRSGAATSCGVFTGSAGKRFFLFWPSGVLRSSGATATLANQGRSLPRGVSPKKTGRPTGRPAGTVNFRGCQF